MSANRYAMLDKEEKYHKSYLITDRVRFAGGEGGKLPLHCLVPSPVLVGKMITLGGK